MGFFDFRCPISGLSLRGAGATHVALIEHAQGRWLPLTLPLTGRYDRLGSIDRLRPDFRTELFAAGFVGFVRAGRVAAPGAPDELAAFRRAPGVEALLELFERVNTMSQWGAMPFTLDGCQLRQVLFHAGVFGALAPDDPRPPPPSCEQLEDQLARAPVAPQLRELYEEIIIADDEVRLTASVALAQLGKLGEYLERQGEGWSPAAETGQFYCDDDLAFAREARARLAGTAELLPVIDRVIARLVEESAL